MGGMPGLTVRSVLEAVGPVILKGVGDCGDQLVTGLSIFDSEAESDIRCGDIVLGVGVVDPVAGGELIRAAASANAAAVLLRRPLAGEPSLSAAVEATGRPGVGLIEVVARMAWTDLVWLLRGVLDSGALHPGRITAPGEFYDLFALADSVASVVDAPVTIEDAHSQVLAYSRQQGETDVARLATIMGRHVPEEMISQYRAQGVFRKLARGREPFFVPGLANGIQPRIVVPIRTGGELLGSIWAIVPGPLPPERTAALADVAAIVAVHLLRVRATFDLARRASSERLRVLLQDGDPAVAEELGLASGPHRVVIFDVQATGAAADVRRLGLLYSLSHRPGWYRPLLAELDGLLYTVVTEGGDARVCGSWPWLGRVVGELTKDEPHLLVAAGGVATTLRHLPRSRDAALDVMALMNRGLVPGPVGCHDDVWAEVVLYRATADAAAMLAGGPLQLLLDHDAAHGTQYASTLRTWLEEQGDRCAASRKLHIHPNTFSYRMRRLLQLAPIDLDCAGTRQALLLQLTAVRMHGRAGGPVTGEQAGRASSSGGDDDITSRRSNHG